jgi:hypothetical protein
MFFGFGKSARIAELEEDNRDLSRENRQLITDKRGLDATATMYRERADIAGRQKAHLEAENNRLAAELKVFTDRRDRAKLNLKQFRGSGSVASNGGTVLNA